MLQQQQQQQSAQQPLIQQQQGISQQMLPIQALQLQVDEQLSGPIQNEANEIDRQIALLRKRRELIELQREVMQMDDTRYGRFDFRAFESMVNPFTGDDTYDIEKWFVDLENAFSVFHCAERDKLVAARSLINGTAKVFLRTISISSYEQLKAELIAEFQHAYSLNEVFQQLQTRKKKTEESLKHYVSVMVEIANRAPALPEQEIVEMIVDGFQDDSQMATILYGAKTIAELKEKLKRFCRTRTPVVVATPSTSKGAIPKQSYQVARTVANTVNISRPAANTSVATNANTNVSGIDMTTIRCFNCFKWGHFQSSCTAPKRPPNACFVCNEAGHVKSQCPRRAQPPNQMPAATNQLSAVDGIDEDWDEDPMEAEVRRLARQLEAKHLASVAFFRHLKCTDLFSYTALFDNGSPTSFIKRSWVPFKVTGDLIKTKYRV